MPSYNGTDDLLRYQLVNITMMSGMHSLYLYSYSHKHHVLFLFVVSLLVIELNDVTVSTLLPVANCFSPFSWNVNSNHLYNYNDGHEDKSKHSTYNLALFDATVTPPSSSRGPSKVSDPSGPTPPNDPVVYPPVKLEDLPEANYDKHAVPIPGQPWRRGETAGCEDPIDSLWRQEAERLIELAVYAAGGTYIDTTWYLTSVCVTIGMDFQDMELDLLRERGPGINVQTTSAPLYYDPDDPDPEDIDYEDDENNPIYERDHETEQSVAKKSYAKADDDEEDDPLESLGIDPESKFRNKERVAF